MTAEYDRLYTAAARMLTAQGSATWREDRWPVRRRVVFGDLESLLSGDRGEADDPAYGLLFNGMDFAAADQALRRYLREDPDGTDRPLVIAGSLHTEVAGALDELAERLRPGRPAAVVDAEFADYGNAVHELANSLRVGLGLMPGSLVRRQVTARDAFESPAGYDRLAALAKMAADTIPPPDELGTDFSVRQGTAVAADDLRRLVGGEDCPAWRERQADVDPARHLVSAYRFTSAGSGGPVSGVEKAIELRAVIAAVEPPWMPSPTKPLPAESSDRSWILYSPRQALVTADLLDELAHRLTPGLTVRRIHFTAWPLHQFVTTTLRAGTTEL